MKAQRVRRAPPIAPGTVSRRSPSCTGASMALRSVAMAFLAVVFLAALTPESWIARRYAAQFRETPDAPPSAKFPLGTDAVGRDRLIRLMYGTRVSLLLAPAAALLSCAAAAA